MDSTLDFHVVILSDIASGIKSDSWAVGFSRKGKTCHNVEEVSPDEFEKIRSDELKLPEGWTLGEEFPRPSHAGGA